MPSARDLEKIWEQQARESRPLLDDLEPLGYSEQDWELGTAPSPAVAAMLIEHLDRPHPEHVHSWSARILGQLRTGEVWDALARALDRTRPEQRSLQESLTSSLAQIATRENLPLVRAYLADKRIGESRMFFYGTLNRLRAPDRWEIIEAGLADPQLRKEAGYRLHQRELREARKQRKK
ncbi:HEAT repeat domain-containing protein [Terrabacter sp. BE26]|uniref:HEAT repeat domain-containing protein n=1 Tax=Terrabacter sp. BE26 TaxID=2898152 RepID=UPI0035BE2048